MSKDEHSTLPLVKVNVVEIGGTAKKGWINCRIGEHLQFSTESLASYFFAKWEPVVFDALLVAAAAEFRDKIKKRPKLGWGREIHLRLPVHDPKSWNSEAVSKSLLRALEFLTGDRWKIEFVARKTAESSPQQGLFQLPLQGQLAVIPFSEGLDSRAVSGLMAKNFGSGLIRVRLGKKSFDKPRDADGRSLPFTTVPYKVTGATFPESTARTRGFKFAMLSGVAAYLANANASSSPKAGRARLAPRLSLSVNLMMISETIPPSLRGWRNSSSLSWDRKCGSNSRACGSPKARLCVPTPNFPAATIGSKPAHAGRTTGTPLLKGSAASAESAPRACCAA
jgi:hypothetical protein